MFEELKSNRETSSKSNQEELLETQVFTHDKIYEKYCGRLLKIDEGYAEVGIDIIQTMLADSDGLIHNGFLFSSASYAAALAVNEKNGFVIASIVHFLAPVKEQDHVIFKARSRHTIGRKRIVDVVGRVEDIKVFIGEFTVIVMEQHISNIQLQDIELPEEQSKNLEDL
jgi:acyl-coenzyme A thioesterase PaaI-like protein